MDKEIYDIAVIAKEALENKKAEDIKVLELGELSNIASFYVIASGSNINQLRAMSDAVEEKLTNAGLKLSHIEGYRTGTWILLDFGNILVHLFNKEERELYKLERVWSDAKEI